GTAEAEEPVAPLDADARGRAAVAHAPHDEPVVGFGDPDANQAPGEDVGLRGGEGRRHELDVVLVAFAPARDDELRAFRVVLAALLELVARVEVPAVDADDDVAAREPGARGGAARVDAGHDHAAARAELPRGLR